MILTLFDVDGTLISTDGAGMRAFYRAIHDILDIKIEKEVIRPDGKTDPLILREFLEYYDSLERWSDATQKEIFDQYLQCLEEEMILARKSGRVRVLPGVKDLLDALSSQSDFAVGLATGNLQAGAGIKLKYAGLYEYFHFGGFGSDSDDRTVLIRIGIQRGIQSVAPATVEDVFVIGDTPFDIIHGRAAGAGVIAVASGRYGIRDLYDPKADLVLSDLASTESILAFMRNRAKRKG